MKILYATYKTVLDDRLQRRVELIFESAGIDSGTLIAPAKTIKDMETIVMNNYINAALCGFFMLVAVTMLISAFFVIRRALNANQPTVHETTPALREEKSHG